MLHGTLVNINMVGATSNSTPMVHGHIIHAKEAKDDE